MDQNDCTTTTTKRNGNEIKRNHLNSTHTATSNHESAFGDGVRCVKTGEGVLCRFKAFIKDGPAAAGSVAFGCPPASAHGTATPGTCRPSSHITSSFVVSVSVSV